MEHAQVFNHPESGWKELNGSRTVNQWLNAMYGKIRVIERTQSDNWLTVFYIKL